LRLRCGNKWGTIFINVAALPQHHAFLTTYPISRMLTFTEGDTMLKIQCIDHGDEKRILGRYEKSMDMEKKFIRAT